MLNFLIRSYKKIMEAAAWIFLIAGGIYGFIQGYDAGGNFIMGLMGVVIWLVFALVLELVCFPPLMILFSINSKLDNIEKMMEDKNNG